MEPLFIGMGVILILIALATLVQTTKVKDALEWLQVDTLAMREGAQRRADADREAWLQAQRQLFEENRDKSVALMKEAQMMMASGAFDDEEETSCGQP